MAGWIYLHPVSQARLGMGWDEKYEQEEKNTVYILPGSGQAERMKKQMRTKQVKWITFDHFVRHLLNSPYRLMSAAEQHWVVQQAVTELEREGELSYFQMVSSCSDNWILSLEKVLGEMKRAGILPMRLKRLWKNKRPKYQELALIYEKYQQLLRRFQVSDHEQYYFDLMQSMSQKTETIHLPDRVVLEHFHDLNPLQEQLLIQLVTEGVEVHLHLMWDETRPRLRNMVEPLVSRLQVKGFQTVPVSRDPNRVKVERISLMHLAENAFSPEPAVALADDALEILSAPGMEAEVDLVVARLKQWLREEQADCSDVAIISAEMDAYARILFKKLEQAGIPVSSPYKQKLSENSLLQTISAAFLMKAGKVEGGRALFCSPHLSWFHGRYTECLRLIRELGDPVRLAEFRQEWDIRQGDQETDPALVAAGRAVEAVFEWVESIPEEETWSGWLNWFQQWMKPLKNKDKWRQMALDPDRYEELAEGMNAWHCLEQLIREWSYLVAEDKGREPVSRTRFLTTLLQSAEQLFVQRKPARRKGVRLLPATQVRGDRFRAVFVLGCVEGKWPRNFSDHWLLPDEAREELRAEEVLLDLSQELRQRQLLPFFMSVISAVDFLVLSYPNTDEDGNRELPSPFLEECVSVFQPDSIHKREKDLSEQVGPPEWQDSFSPDQGLEFAFSRLTRPVDDESSSLAVSVLDDLLRRSPRMWQSLVNRIQAEQARRMDSFTRFDGVAEDVKLRRQLEDWAKRQIWSATDLNKMMTCRFHFMAEKIWKAHQAEDIVRGISRLEEGELIHEALCRFFSEYRQGKWSFRDEEHARERLMTIAGETAEKLLARVRGRHPSYLRIEKQRLKQTLSAFWNHELHWRKETNNYHPPAYLELSFGLPLDLNRQADGLLDPRSVSEPVSIPLSRHTLRLKGKIDRVDVNEGYYAVYDYKTGQAPSAQEIQEGRQLQLPLYLWALEHGFGFSREKAVGAAFYTRGTSQSAPVDNRNKGLWKKELADRAGIGKQVRSRLDQDTWDEVEKQLRSFIEDQLDKVMEGDFAVDPAWTCPEYCPQRKICRFSHRKGGRE
ncbi:PD-(D/E)XK nuclease family protein [Lihuaxuella thermophila]|uniref:ATP-dependent helicase/DNAse subunit B n=1 Tax=Lihuaxuella thermophila TaxID=1173111 RepID=A0A1H8ATC7_9BACL|nr:PD-(D/E)XK nuclease family protein [Lihuaxuella thermophila]SEM72747.1 ATP-dependent helicase/DNAse subunit B [Lihuaxuella thermophila]